MIDKIFHSPFCSSRPDDVAISLIVIHCISLPPDEFGGDGIEQLFMGTLDWQAHPFYQSIAGLEVSAHYVIRRNGELLQFVDPELKAWHAGVSCYQGRSACNDFSIGIELEGADDIPYTDQQYTRLAQLCAALIGQYPELSRETIASHAEIAPDRKTDPGPAFIWAEFNKRLNELL